MRDKKECVELKSLFVCDHTLSLKAYQKSFKKMLGGLGQIWTDFEFLNKNLNPMVGVYL